LLSFSLATPDYAHPNSASSSIALAEYGIMIQPTAATTATPAQPIVVTEGQYHDYVTSVNGNLPKAFFVLPDPLGGNTLATAQYAMQVTCFGM
jgi:hypothetical protein